MHAHTGMLPNTHTADETFTPLSLKYYPDIPPLSPSTPPFDLMEEKKSTLIFTTSWEKKIYKNISPAAHIDLVDLLGSRPLSLPLSISCFTFCFGSALLRHSQTLLQSFWIPTLLCPRSPTSPPPPLQLSLFHSPKQLNSLGNIWQSVTAWRMRVKEDGVLMPICEIQPITAFFFILDVIKQLLWKHWMLTDTLFSSAETSVWCHNLMLLPLSFNSFIILTQAA